MTLPDRLTAYLHDFAPPLALIISLTATLGSLYYSEVAGFVPCTLCWYQRILMYPLVIIILLGMLRQDKSWPGYVLPLALIGLGVSGYHVLVQNAVFSQPGTCTTGVPCSFRYINYFGFVTIPLMALTAFGLLAAAAALLIGRAVPGSWEDEPLATLPTANELLRISRARRAGSIAAAAILLGLLGTILWSASRGEGSPAGISPDASGESLFLELRLGDAPGCAVCHSVEPGLVMVGPSMSGLGAVAGERVPGLSARAYLRQAIVDPDAHIVEGYAAGVMYPEYAKALTDEQIERLVDYLLELP